MRFRPLQLESQGAERIRKMPALSQALVLGQELYRVWHRYLAGQTLYLQGDMLVWCVKPPPRPSVSEFRENPLDACMKYKAFKQYQKYSVW